MKIILKLTVGLLFVLILTTFNSCIFSDDEEEIDCAECITVQTELCHAYRESNYAENDKTKRLQEMIIDACPNAAFKIAQIKLSNLSDLGCSYQGYNCE